MAGLAGCHWPVSPGVRDDVYGNADQSTPRMQMMRARGRWRRRAPPRGRAGRCSRARRAAELHRANALGLPAVLGKQ